MNFFVCSSFFSFFFSFWGAGWGGGGGACQLRGQSCTLMIVPLLYYDNFATTTFRSSGKKKCVGVVGNVGGGGKGCGLLPYSFKTILPRRNERKFLNIYASITLSNSILEPKKKW